VASAATARDELENARAALAFIQDDLLGQASPDRQPDPHLTVRALLDRASAQFDQPTNRPPKVEAALRQTIGSVYFDLGEYALAISHLERALVLQQQNLGPAHEDTLRTFYILGETHWWNGDDAKALELARKGLALSRQALGETSLLTLSFLANGALASIYTEAGTTEEIDRRIRDALKVIRATLGDTHRLTFRVEVVLGAHLSDRGKYDEAEAVLSQAIERQKLVFPETDQLMLQAVSMRAKVNANLSKLDVAEAMHRRVLELRQSVNVPNHAMTVNIEIHLAMIHLKREEFSQPEKIHGRLLDLLAEGRLVESRMVVRSLVDLTRVYRHRREWAKVDELAGAVLATGRRQFEDEATPLQLIDMEDEWGRSLMAQERFAEAEPHFRRAMEIRTLRHNTHGRRFSAMSRLGDCLFKQNKELPHAEALLKGAATELEKRFNQLPERTRLEIAGGAQQRLADFYGATGRSAEAAVYKQKVAELEKAEGRPLLGNDYLPVF
jgi:tetratricopeptide (TPR) repeat protein